MLDRLTVRDRVGMLALVPLLVVAVLLVPLFAERLDRARAAAAVARGAVAARQTGQLAEQIQQVRLLSVTYLGTRTVTANDLVVGLNTLADSRERLLGSIDPAAEPALSAALRRARGLDGFGGDVLARRVAARAAATRFSESVTDLVDALTLTRRPSLDRDGLAELTAQDALLRSDEAASLRGAMLLAAAMTPGSDRSPAVLAARDAEQAEDVSAGVFERLAAPADVELFDATDGGPSAARLTELEDRIARSGEAVLPATFLADVLATTRAQTDARQLVESRLAGQAAVRAQADLTAALTTTAALALAGLIVGIGMVVLSVVVARSVTRPLRRLTLAAGQVADLAQEELLRVADSDAAHGDRVPRLAAIDVRTDDEMGELAAAFNRVQATAALLLERQIAGRRNVARMFGIVGRRTSNLVGRQLSLIDSLEQSEEDPDRLATLYRLDHAATRLRRSASSLIVLSGTAQDEGVAQPAPLGDVVRSAVGTVEDFQRITLRKLPKLWVAPGAVSDLVLLLAELIDNAASFSPPDSEVEVVGAMTRDGGCSLTIVDHGAGMPSSRLAEENERLRRRERLDLAPSDVLGLFVVGRIARRYGVEVTLRATPRSGVTAVVELPASVMVDARTARRRSSVAAGRVGGANRHGTNGGRSTGGRNTNGGRSTDVLSPAGIVADRPDTPIVPPPPPGAEGLRRRTPGAHLSGLEDALPRDTGDGVAPNGLADALVDAELARRDIEEVEQALERARRSAEDEAT